ncbi:MAG: serine kinase [Cyanobacteria bacterium J06632_22]
MIATLKDPAFPTSQREDTEALTFYQCLKTTFETAAGGLSSTDNSAHIRDYQVGGFRLRLRFGSAALIPKMTPALAHLEVPSNGTADFTIRLWDTVSSGVQIPSPPWQDDPYAYGSHGEVGCYSKTRVRIVFNFFVEALSMLNVEQNEAVFWVRDVNNIPFWETAAPLRILLHWWLGSRQLKYVHAAVVGTDTAGAMLVGKGGSGKSTTALSCLKSPLTYVSDDYCLLSAQGEPRAYSLYSSAKLKPDNTLLPELTPLIHNSDRKPDEKPYVLLHEHFPNKIVSSLPVRVILLPRVTGKAETTVQAASGAAALLALAPSTLFQLPGGSSNAFQEMAALVKALPCYWLDLGTNLAQIPSVIADVIRRHGPHA